MTLQEFWYFQIISQMEHGHSCRKTDKKEYSMTDCTSKFVDLVEKCVKWLKENWGWWEWACQKDLFVNSQVFLWENMWTDLISLKRKWKKKKRKCNTRLTGCSAMKLFCFGTIKGWLQTAEQHRFDTCHGCFVNTLDKFLPNSRLLVFSVTVLLLLLWQILQNRFLHRSSEKIFSRFNVGGAILHPPTEAG